MDERRNNSLESEFLNHKDTRSCLNVFNLPYDIRCEYVKTSGDCNKRGDLVNYIQIMVCNMNINSRLHEIETLAVLILVTISYGFLISIVADRYFVPALKIFMHFANLTEHMAGVTLLSITYSLSEIFERVYISDLSSPLITNSLSGGMFVTMLTGGIICVLAPFQMNPFSTTRDLLFFISAVVMCDVAMRNDQHFSWLEACCLLAFYGVFLIVMLIDDRLMRREIERLRKKLHLMYKQHERNHVQEEILKLKLKEMRESLRVDIKRHTSRGIYTKSGVVNIRATARAHHVYGTPRNRFLRHSFFEEINPINPYYWEKANVLHKILMILRAPFVFFCVIYIPRVDYEEKRHAWTKLLNCMHIITMPSLTCFILIGYLQKSHFFWKLNLDPMLLVYPLPATIPIAILVFLNTRTDKPPRYHFVFTIMCIIASGVVFFVCESETLQIVILICKVLKLSEDFIGTSFAAISYSYGNLVVNTVLTNHGYSQMAFASAFGGPFFNLVLITSASIISNLAFFNKHSIFIPIGKYSRLAFVFILIATSTTLFWALILNFQARRSVGIYSLLIYFIFLLMAILIEAEVIQSWQEDPKIHFPIV